VSQKVQRNDPCPCGSGKKYKKCCLLKEHDHAAARADRRNAVQKALGWLSQRHRSEIDDWVEKVWLVGIDAAERAGIASADPRIRSIHDINLLEFLIAEGSFESEEGEGTSPLQLILASDELALDDNQRNYLQQLAERPLQLYRVSDVVPGENFSLTTLNETSSAAIVIKDKMASRMFDIGDTVGLRLMQTGDDWETSGAIYHIPDEYVDELQQELANAEKGTHSLTMAHFWLGLVAAHV